MSSEYAHAKKREIHHIWSEYQSMWRAVGECHSMDVHTAKDASVDNCGQNEVVFKLAPPL
jgi:hypothetical protein